MASYNFMHAAFQPKIFCSSPTVDGYEISNLVTSSAPPKGFLGENFVKPPINIHIMFPCNIDLDRILINRAVGPQKSCGFEIYTHSEKRKTCCWLAPGESNVVLNDNALDAEFKERVFLRIGKNFDINLTADMINFQNDNYRKRDPNFPGGSSNPMIPRGVGAITTKCDIRCRQMRNVTNVSHMTVRIVKTEGGSVCAMKWLEIWGQPAYTTPVSVMKTVQTIAVGINNDNCTSYNSMPYSSSTNNNTKSDYSNCSQQKVINVQNKDLSNTSNNSPIPDEFIDPITTDLMKIPILLPSCNTIDKETLDRYAREEAKWGRVASDPFTGIVFSQSRKPMLNAALKVRLDHFVLANQGKLPTGGRTVGRDNMLFGARHIQPSISSLVERNCRNGAVLDSNQSGAFKSPPSQTGVKREADDCYITSVKCRKTDVNKYTISPRLKNCTPSNQQLHSSDSKHPSCSLKIKRGQCIKEETGVSAHEDRLKDSLDLALSSVLSNVPTSTSPSISSDNCPVVTNTARESSPYVLPDSFSNVFISCTNCSVASQQKMYYKLSCQHTICRDCLTKSDKNNVKCASCEQISCFKDVVKVH